LFNQSANLFFWRSSLLSFNIRCQVLKRHVYIFIEQFESHWGSTLMHTHYFCVYIDIDIGNLALLSNSNSDNIYMFFAEVTVHSVLFCPNMCTIVEVQDSRRYHIPKRVLSFSLSLCTIELLRQQCISVVGREDVERYSLSLTESIVVVQFAGHWFLLSSNGVPFIFLPSFFFSLLQKYTHR